MNHRTARVIWGADTWEIERDLGLALYEHSRAIVKSPDMADRIAGLRVRLEQVRATCDHDFRDGRCWRCAESVEAT